MDLAEIAYRIIDDSRNVIVDGKELSEYSEFSGAVVGSAENYLLAQFENQLEVQRIQLSVLKSQTKSPLAQCLRKTDKAFVERTVANVCAGMALEPAAQDAAESVWLKAAANPTSALAWAKKKLRQPDVQQAIEAIYEAEGFPLSDMVQLQIKHAKGELRKQVVTKDGDIVDVYLPPNYKALSDVMAAVGMTPARQVHVKSENFNHTVAPVSVSEPIDVTPRDFGE